MALGTAGTVIAAALVAGAVGAGTTVLLVEPARAPSAPPGADEATAAVLARLERQEKEIASLRKRVDEAASARPAPASATTPAAHPPGSPRAADGQTELRPSPADAPGADPSAVPPAADVASMAPEERAKYEAVYKAMREKEQEDARKARAAAFEMNLRSRLDRIPEKFALTAEQKDAAVKLLLDQSNRMRAVFDEARTAGTPEA